VCVRGWLERLNRGSICLAWVRSDFPPVRSSPGPQDHATVYSLYCEGETGKDRIDAVRVLTHSGKRDARTRGHGKMGRLAGGHNILTLGPSASSKLSPLLSNN